MITAIDKPDILDTVRAEGIELKQRGRNFWACCPFHAEHTASFKVDLERQTFYCFSCHEHGDSIAFIQQYKSLSFREALSYLGIDSSTKPSPETLQRMRRTKEKAELVKGFRQWCNDYHDDLCSLYRCLQNAKDKCRTLADAEAIAEWYHKEPLWLYQLDILEGRDDRAKFELYKEMKENGNEF